MLLDTRDSIMNKFNTLTASMLVTALSLTACNNDNDTVIQPNETEINDQQQLISGTVIDANGNPIVGADVKVGKRSVLTDNAGTYSLNLDNKASNAVILVRKLGYLTMAREVKIESKRAHHLDITLTPDQITSAFAANAGVNNLQVSGAEVSIPANSIVNADGNDYTGTVNIAANYYNPDSIEGARSFAQPFTGQNEDGSQQTNLVTVGVLDVKLTDPATGATLNLKEGTQATLVYPEVTTDQNLPSIPLWYYDEEKTIWVKDGVATRQPDGSYKGQVSHFTLWNLDIPLNEYYAVLTGCMIDSKTKKPYVKDYFAAIKGRGSFSNSGGTDNDGKFSIRVPFNTPLTLFSYSYSVGFSTIQIPALAQNGTYQINNGDCIEVNTVNESSGQIDLNNSDIGTIFDELPLAPVPVTPVPSIPDAPFIPPTEQNTAGLIGYNFSFDTDSDTATGLENVFISTLSTNNGNSTNIVEKSLYDVEQDYDDFEAQEQLSLTTMGISPQFRFSLTTDNAIKTEQLNTVFTNNRYIQRLSNGFVSTGTYTDVQLAGQKIGTVLALENNNDFYNDIPDSVIDKLNNLPSSLSIFSNGASCKKALTGSVNVDYISLNYKLPGLSFDQAVTGFGNARRGTWAGIPWIAEVKDVNSDDDSSTAFVNYKNEVYAASFVDAESENLKEFEKDDCAFYNEVAKNQILTALRTAYPTL